MTRLHSIPDRALELAHGLKANLMDAMPSGADWLKTGAALGAARTGARVAGGFARRHPVALVALAVGAGTLWYLSRRNKQKQADGRHALQGTARRVDATPGRNPRRDPSYTGTGSAASSESGANATR